MYFFFSTVLTASLLIYTELSAVSFVATLLLTVFYLFLFSVYFRCCQKTVVFLPLVLVSVSMHIAFFLLEQINKFIKEINIWVLALFLIIVCGIIVYGNNKNKGFVSIKNMSVPVFFLLVFVAVIAVISFKTNDYPLWSGNLYQYILLMVSPPSTAFALNYIHQCRFRKMWPAFVTAVAITVCFLLFDSPFFKNIALTFVVPFIISAEMIVIKETILSNRQGIKESIIE